MDERPPRLLGIAGHRWPADLDYLLNPLQLMYSTAKPLDHRLVIRTNHGPQFIGQVFASFVGALVQQAK